MLLFRGGTLCILDFDWIYSKHNLFLSSIKFFFFCFVSLIMPGMQKMRSRVVMAITLMVVV